MWDYRHRVSVVSGAAQGMGRAFVRELCARGARVAACDIDEAALDETAASLRGSGHGIFSRRVDVADAAARAAFVAEVGEQLGPIELLINNAGVGTSGPFCDIAGDDWKWIRSINLDAPLDFMRLVLPGMIARRDGRILNVASVSGLMVQPYVSGYVATKHALVGLSRAVHEEVRPFGVGVTVACPGLVRTSILDRVRARNLDVGSTRWLFRFGIEPEIAVTRMLKAVERRAALTIPNHDAHLVHLLYRLAPGAFDRLVGTIAARAYAVQKARRPDA